MAKKRVHELAKQYDMPSKEVLDKLAAAGIEVKAAASAVDEDAADRALTGKPPREASTNGAGADGAAPETDGKAAAGADKPRQRPTRSSLQGERAPGAAGGVRRVVIDSQASRRQGGPAADQPAPSAARRAAAGAVAAAPTSSRCPGTSPRCRPTSSGSTRIDGQGRRRVLRRRRRRSDQEAHGARGDGDADPDPVRRGDRCARRGVRQAGRDRPRRRRARRGPRVRGRGRGSRRSPARGHDHGPVDRGKTSLLDAVRQTEVAAGEPGHHPTHRRLPGPPRWKRSSPSSTPQATRPSPPCAPRRQVDRHPRAIVVAADDGVKPQTEEAIDHARAAEVPIVVAVNKIDKEGAQPERVRTEMTQRGLQPAEWGGKKRFSWTSRRRPAGARQGS